MSKHRSGSGRKSGLGGLTALGLTLGFVGGVVVSHVFRSSVDGVWNAIPVLKEVKTGYAHSYY